MRALRACPVLTAVLGALTIAFSAIFVRLADVSPATAAIFRCAYALPPLAVLAWYKRRRYGPCAAGQARLAWIAGAFFAADLVMWHHAIGQVGAGLATVLGNTQVVIVPIAAWLFLGERPGGRVAASVWTVAVGPLSSTRLTQPPNKGRGSLAGGWISSIPDSARYSTGPPASCVASRTTRARASVFSASTTST